MKLTYFSACVFLVLCSCGKKDSTRTVNPPAPPVIQKIEVNSVSDFKGKSNEEILAMKYDKITLKCDLWTQFAKELDLKISPNDSFEVDFLNDTSLKKSAVKPCGFPSGA